jgi:hypothetical protein
MIEEELLREIRLQNAILRAAFRDRIDALAREVRQDPVSAAVLEALRENGRMPSGALKDAVMNNVPKGTDVSLRTITRRLADLENKGVVEQIGQSRNTGYELTRLIE